MKTKTSILALTKAFFILLVSCGETTYQRGGETTYPTVTYPTEIIDGCEYIKRYEGYQRGYSFSHKGNCKNPIHYKVIHDTIYVVRSK